MYNMSSQDQRDCEQQILTMVREVVKFDADLREQYQVGDKFRFVRERLHALLARLEVIFQPPVTVASDAGRIMGDDEIVVYVYLYNVNGMQLRSWQNMLTSDVFYEYSVNRPIYARQDNLTLLLKSKVNKLQHAYFSIVVKQADVIQQTGIGLKDVSGSPMLRLREGSLHFQNLISFTHNEIEYQISAHGELIEKKRN